MPTVTLDQEHRWAVARLDPGQILTVTAPPCVGDVTGQEDRPWVLIGYDDFGVRPAFVRNREFVSAHFIGALAVQLDAASKEIQADPDGPRVARMVSEPRGTKRKPQWHAIGHELVADDGRVRLDAMAEFESMLGQLAAEGFSIPAAEVLRLFRLAMAART